MYSKLEQMFNGKNENNKNDLNQGKEYGDLQNTILNKLSLKLPDLENLTKDNPNDTIIETLETNGENELFNDNNKRSDNLSNLKLLQEKYNKYINELKQLTEEIIKKENYNDNTKKDEVSIKNNTSIWLGCQLNKLYQDENECKKSCFNCDEKTFFSSKVGRKNWNIGEKIKFYQCESKIYEDLSGCKDDKKNVDGCCSEFIGTIYPKSNEEKEKKIKMLRIKIKNLNEKIQELTYVLNQKSEDLFYNTMHSDNIIKNQNNHFTNQTNKITNNKGNINQLILNKENLKAQLEGIKLNASSNNVSYILWLIAAATLGGILITRMINR